MLLDTIGWELMLWFGIIFGLVFLIGGIIGLCISIDDIKTDEKYCMKHSITAKDILSPIALCLGLFMSIFNPIYAGKKIYNAIQEEYSYLKYEIVSLEKNDSLEGHFVLGTGYIESDKVYYYYTITDRGYKLESSSYKYTYLEETNDKEPSVYHCKDKGEDYSYFIIYCPEGTIVKEFHA